MRKYLIAGLLAILAMPAFGADYPKAEVFGGYQYTRLEGGINANGFNFAVTGNFSEGFGITADIGAGYKTVDGANFSNYTYAFGPVIALRANRAFTPFAHVLIGGDHASAGAEGVSVSSNGYPCSPAGESTRTLARDWRSVWHRLTGCSCTTTATPAARTLASRPVLCSSSRPGQDS